MASVVDVRLCYLCSWVRDYVCVCVRRWFIGHVVTLGWQHVSPSSPAAQIVYLFVSHLLPYCSYVCLSVCVCVCASSSVCARPPDVFIMRLYKLTLSSVDRSTYGRLIYNPVWYYRIPYMPAVVGTLWWISVVLGLWRVGTGWDGKCECRMRMLWSSVDWLIESRFYNSINTIAECKVIRFTDFTGELTQRDPQEVREQEP